MTKKAIPGDWILPKRQKTDSSQLILCEQHLRASILTQVRGYIARIARVELMSFYKEPELANIWIDVNIYVERDVQIVSFKY